MTNLLAGAIKSGIEKGSKSSAEKDARGAEYEKVYAARLEAAWANTKLIEPGLQILNDMPGSAFSYKVGEQLNRIYIYTNVVDISGNSEHGIKAAIIVGHEDISAYGFSWQPIHIKMSDPDAANKFLGLLAEALAARKIVPAAPKAAVGTSPQVASRTAG